MAWINVIGLSEATGLLKALYDKYFVSTGVEHNITMVSSLNPKALKLNHKLYSLLMRGRSDLTRAQREMILTIANVARYYDYANRLADGLGLQLESTKGPPSQTCG